MNVESKIIRERVQLLLNYPFFGTLALGLEPEERRDMPMPTMATDGRKLYYDPDWVASLIPEQLRAVICHEVMHNALQHLWRMETRDMDKWNIATDETVNLLLNKEGFQLPQGVLMDKKFDNMSAEQIYVLLPDPPKNKITTLDWHGEWGKGEEEEGKAGGTGREGEESKDNGNGETLEQTWRSRVAQAATAARMQGKLPGSMEGIVQDILEPRLNWRVLLRNFIQSAVKNNYRIVPPNKKHLWRNIYLPSVTGEKLEIAFAVDTSGSMTGRRQKRGVTYEEFMEGIAEVKGITEQFEDYVVHFYMADAAVQEYLELTPYETWPEKMREGRGGTDFRPVLDHIQENNLDISCLVYFTDCYGYFPDSPPEYPVLWLVTTDHPIPWGERIEMRD